VEFFRNIDTYMAYGGNFYKLHVSTVTFNQTFKQKGTKQKTLHSRSSLIESSEINEANPAQFELDLLMVDGESSSSRYQHKLLEILLTNTNDTLNTFDLYIDPSEATDSPRKMYKLSLCVLESGSFNISRSEVLSVSLAGSASKLERVNHSTFSIGSFTTAANTTYSIPKIVTVTVDGTVLDQVTGISLEVQNNIQWTKNNTLQQSLVTTNASNSNYPTSFTLKGRDVAGSITTYVGSSASDIQTWKENIGIRIQAGLAANNYQLDANLTPCSFTNRVSPTEVFTQGYDFRMTGSPTNLNTLFTY
jgi:hypothetical protein